MPITKTFDMLNLHGVKGWIRDSWARRKIADLSHTPRHALRLAHGTTTTIDLDTTYNRLMATGHNSGTSARGLYIITSNGVFAVIPAAFLTVSISDGTLTIVNSAASGTIAGVII